jgi:hypothetical protein
MNETIMDFNELLGSTGIDVPVIANTGEAFEYYQHCEGEYEGLLGKFSIDYVDGEGKKVAKGTPGSKQRDFGMNVLLITKSPDNHGFASDFEVKNEQVYGEFMINQFVTLDPNLQYRNKALYDTFKIAGAPMTDVVVEGSAKSDFKINLNALGFYIGAPVKWEMKEYTSKAGKKSVNVNGLTLTNNLLSKEIFAKRKELVDNLHGKLEILKKAEEEARKAKKAKSEDDKALSGIGGMESTSAAEELMGSSGFNPKDYE